MYCIQNELIIDYAPVYPYKANGNTVKTYCVNTVEGVNLQIWGLDGTGVLPVQPYRTNRIVRKGTLETECRM